MMHSYYTGQRVLIDISMSIIHWYESSCRSL